MPYDEWKRPNRAKAWAWGIGLGFVLAAIIAWAIHG